MAAARPPAEEGHKKSIILSFNRVRVSIKKCPKSRRFVTLNRGFDEKANHLLDRGSFGRESRLEVTIVLVDVSVTQRNQAKFFQTVQQVGVVNTNFSS